jgi:transposase InsO family protein
LLEFLELPRSTYYYVIKSINKSNLDEDLMKEITNIFNESHKRYGYRRVTLVLNKNRIKKVNHKKVKRIMKELGLFAIQGKNGKYHSYKGDNGEFKENLLLEKVVDEEKHKTTYQRHFETEKPNEKWVTDVSEFKHPDGKLYLSPVLDLHDHSIIAYDISTSPNFEQTKRMIDKAFEANPNLEGLIFHSDQGWQYQMKQYKQWLNEKGIKQSFSRKGNCMDNSVMENFFGIIKNEMFYGHENEFETLDDLRKAIEEYIEWYNSKRISIKRNGMSPFEYRQHSILQLQY